MFEREKHDLHAELLNKFRKVGEHNDWINLGDSVVGKYRRFLRQRAIGNNLVVDYVEYSPRLNRDFVHARLERVVENQDGQTLSAEASSFVKNSIIKEDNVIRSGISGPGGDRISWNQNDTRAALVKTREMVSRIK